MVNCSVNLVGSGDVSADQPIYLEQRIGGFNEEGLLLRSRFYGFNEGNNYVELNIQSFHEENSVLGLCNQPESEREIESINIIEESCDIS